MAFLRSIFFTSPDRAGQEREKEREREREREREKWSKARQRVLPSVEQGSAERRTVCGARLGRETFCLYRVDM